MGTAAAVFDPRVEAAVLARYGVDPQECTLRRLRVLLMALPPGYWPEEDHAGNWSVESHLLAGVVDAVNQVAWINASANSKRRIKRPQPMDRPGARQRKRGMSIGELGRMLIGGGRDGG